MCYLCLCLTMCVFLHMSACVWMFVGVCVCVCVCVCVYMCVLYVSMPDSVFVRKWHKSAVLDDLASYQTLLASFSSSITAAKKTFFNDKINGATDARTLFYTFTTLLHPPPPPPASHLTA